MRDGPNPEMSTEDRVYEIGSPAPVSMDTSGPSRMKVFHAQRPRLFSIAYRMLGSVADAEDILQDAFIRWQQSSVTDIRSPEAFLVTIVSRLCLNHLQSARVKREEYFGQWLPEPILTAEAATSFPDPKMDDSLSMAFLVLLERLTPLERAVFLLREVFDYDYPEIARIVEQTAANCRQILRRARQHLKRDRPRFDASPQQQEQLLNSFLEASANGDMDALLAVISNDIVLYADGGGKANAVPNPVYGAENVVRFLLGVRKKFLPTELIRQVVQINGKPGIVGYVNGRPYGVITINVVDGRIRNIYIVSNPDKLYRLPNLPSSPC